MGDTGLDVQGVARQVFERVKEGHETITLPCVVLEDLIRIAQAKSLLTDREGFVTVPREPTEAMTAAAIRDMGYCDDDKEDAAIDCRVIYRAMIAAAPKED